jgi:hypothetical protein
MEFEHFSSVKASSRRRTPVWINSSTWAFTFSTPASGESHVPAGAAPYTSRAATAAARIGLLTDIVIGPSPVTDTLSRS